MRSFLRHISAASNENRLDPEVEKKRKRESARLSSNVVSNSSALPSVEDRAPNKKLRNMDEYRDDAHTSNALPKSIESLYASIMSAEKELEAGRMSWEGDGYYDS
jgi:hypothetical protein